jgi:hypothetical protein
MAITGAARERVMMVDDTPSGTGGGDTAVEVPIPGSFGIRT